MSVDNYIGLGKISSMGANFTSVAITLFIWFMLRSSPASMYSSKNDIKYKVISGEEDEPTEETTSNNIIEQQQQKVV